MEICPGSPMSVLQMDTEPLRWRQEWGSGLLDPRTILSSKQIPRSSEL